MADQQCPGTGFEVRQAADMIQMPVGQDDGTDIFRFHIKGPEDTLDPPFLERVSGVDQMIPVLRLDQKDLDIPGAYGEYEQLGSCTHSIASYSL